MIYNYHFFTLATDGNVYFARKYATGVQLPRKTLWEEIRKCKIMVVQNNFVFVFKITHRLK